MEELVKYYIWGMGLYGVENLTLWKIRNTLKVLKGVAGEGWRRPVGPNMWKMVYFEGSRRKEHPTYNKMKEG